MQTTRIDGRAVSAAVKADVAEQVRAFTEKTGVIPGLAVVIVGEDPASCVYVRNKCRACAETGIASVAVTLPENTSEEELLKEIGELNRRHDVHGILVQLPLPRHIRESKVLEAISPDKDVDGFHPFNMGHLLAGTPRFVPCTPAGIMEMLDRCHVPVEGARCVVVGRSNIVGKPVAQLMLARNATVTVCHSRTKDLASVTREADILIVAIGKPRFITADMVKEGAVVIDVGINRTENGLCGDVDYDALIGRAAAVTPVPGGVGPMTIAMLMKNALLAARRLSGEEDC